MKTVQPPLTMYLTRYNYANVRLATCYQLESNDRAWFI